MEGGHWHALLVRPRYERIVALHLTKQGIESYLPLLRLSRKNGRELPSIQLPLFPGYVFCKSDARDAVWTIPGVLSFVGTGNGIQAVADREISDLRRILAGGFDIQRWRFTSQGEPVSIHV